MPTLPWDVLDGLFGRAEHCPSCGHAVSTAHWLMIGFLGQAVFTARFLVQWVASERKRDSVVPLAFWWLSMAGGWILLAYAIHRNDPVIMLGQSMGVFIYIRNLMLAAKGRRRASRSGSRSRSAPPSCGPHTPGPALRADARHDGAPSSS